MSRRVAFVAIALVMLLGPFARQVLGINATALREWRMYGTRADDSCRVLFERRVGEDWQRVSRWDVLDLAADGWPKRGLRIITSPRAADRHGRAICEALGDGASVRYRLRCADLRAGWDDWTVSGDLCR